MMESSPEREIDPPPLLQTPAHVPEERPGTPGHIQEPEEPEPVQDEPGPVSEPSSPVSEAQEPVLEPHSETIEPNSVPSSPEPEPHKPVSELVPAPHSPSVRIADPDDEDSYSSSGEEEEEEADTLDITELTRDFPNLNFTKHPQSGIIAQPKTWTPPILSNPPFHALIQDRDLAVIKTFHSKTVQTGGLKAMLGMLNRLKLCRGSKMGANYRVNDVIMEYLGDELVVRSKKCSYVTDNDEKCDDCFNETPVVTKIEPKPSLSIPDNNVNDVLANLKSKYNIHISRGAKPIIKPEPKEEEYLVVGGDEEYEEQEEENFEDAFEDNYYHNYEDEEGEYYEEMEVVAPSPSKRGRGRPPKKRGSSDDSDEEYVPGYKKKNKASKKRASSSTDDDSDSDEKPKKPRGRPPKPRPPGEERNNTEAIKFKVQNKPGVGRKAPVFEMITVDEAALKKKAGRPKLNLDIVNEDGSVTVVKKQKRPRGRPKNPLDPNAPQPKFESCPHCHKCSSTKERLEIHVKVCRQRPGRKILPAAKPGPVARLPLLETPKQCPLCLASFRRIKFFNVHMFAHKKYDPIHVKIGCPGQGCGEEFHPKDMNEHYAEKHDSTQGVCIVCKIVVRKGELQKHYVDVHRPLEKERMKGSLLCPECGKVFARQHMLNLHIFRNHRESQNLICHQCGDILTDPISLRRHTYRRHEQKKGSFKCRFCPKIFARHQARYKHELLHSITKPYKCIFCDYRAHNKYNCRVHLKHGHKDVEPTNEYIIKDMDFQLPEIAGRKIDAEEEREEPGEVVPPPPPPVAMLPPPQLHPYSGFMQNYMH